MTLITPSVPASVTTSSASRDFLLLPVRLLVGLIALLAPLCLFHTTSTAAPVTVLAGQENYVRDDPFLPPRSALPEPRASNPSAVANISVATDPTKTVPVVLEQMLLSGQITQADYDGYTSEYDLAKQGYKKLRKVRRRELGAVIKTIQRISATGMLTPSRAKPLFITLARNRQWWTTGPLLRYGQRVTFPTTKLIFQYYPGQGIQLQMLANWARANQYWLAEDFDEQLRQLLDELVPLAAERAGGIAWEYYFSFDGGSPPWVSSLAEGTALQALSRSAIRLGDNTLFDTARRSLGIFTVAPPEGVRLDTVPGSSHYLIYSFNRKLRILNAFIQSLVGLYDFAQLANDEPARQLFAAGDTQAQREVPKYDTGKWSLYRPGKKSDIGYHRLLRDFLKNLCERTSTDIYCSTADNFTQYLRKALGV